MPQLTTALLGEHAAFYLLADRVEAAIAAGASPECLKTWAEALTALIVPHAASEERLLFEALAPRIGRMGPIGVMEQEHGEIEDLAAALANAGDAAELAAGLRDLCAVARTHFAKEEHVLFPLADQQLGGGAQDGLCEAWAKDRRVVLGEGAFGC